MVNWAASCPAGMVAIVTGQRRLDELGNPWTGTANRAPTRLRRAAPPGNRPPYATTRTVSPSRRCWGAPSGACILKIMAACTGRTRCRSRPHDEGRPAAPGRMVNAPGRPVLQQADARVAISVTSPYCGGHGAAQSSLATILGRIRRRTSCWNVVFRMAEKCPNIVVSVKEATGFNQASQVARSDLLDLPGDDSLTLLPASIGGKGVEYVVGKTSAHMLTACW